MNEDIVRMMQTGNFDSAITELNAIIADDLDNYDAILGAAISYLESERLEEGKKALDYYHANTEPTYESLEALGIYYVRIDDSENAEKYLNEALEIYPESGNIRRNLAMVYVMQRRWDEAASELQRAVDADPENYLTQIAVAQFKLMNGELDAAAEILTDIITSPFEIPPEKLAVVQSIIDDIETIQSGGAL